VPGACRAFRSWTLRLLEAWGIVSTVVGRSAASDCPASRSLSRVVAGVLRMFRERVYTNG
jgi:hypothetical protein